MQNNQMRRICCGGEAFAHYKKTGRSQQGMAIWKDQAFLFYHGGACDVMNLKTGEIVHHFRLDSYTGDGSAPDVNHANQALFGGTPEMGQQYPLLYVTAGNAAGYDSDGYYGRCIVEQISFDESVGTFRSRRVQTICFQDDAEKRDESGCYAAPALHPFEPPCWGWPSFLPDAEHGRMLIFSARYRTKLREYDDVNRYIITAFRLPQAEDGAWVTLRPADILDQFEADYDIGATQGGMVYQDKIYYTFGFGRADFPDGMRVFDLKKRRLITAVDLSHSIFAQEEIESCGVYQGQLLCNTNRGGLYSLGKAEEFA